MGVESINNLCGFLACRIVDTPRFAGTMPGLMGVPAKSSSTAYTYQHCLLITNYIIKSEECQIEAYHCEVTNSA
jgi:hypothetical protein